MSVKQNCGCETSEWNELCQRRKGGRLRGQGRGSHMTLFREDPTTVIIFRLNSLIRQLIISNCSFKTFEEYHLLGLG